MSQKTWIYIGIPFRPTSGTYSIFDYYELPIVSTEKFAKIQTIDDIKQNLDELDEFIDSPTACYFDFSEPNLFYRDQQGCVSWYHDRATGQVTTENEQVVADSLAQFLARIYIENMIWFKTSHIQHPDAYHSMGFLSPEELNDHVGLWKALCLILDHYEITYLQSYYDKYCQIYPKGSDASDFEQFWSQLNGKVIWPNEIDLSTIKQIHLRIYQDLKAKNLLSDNTYYNHIIDAIPDMKLDNTELCDIYQQLFKML